MTSETTTTVLRRCDRCGRPLRWTMDQLLAHQAMLQHGQHAACACDDDCAAEVSPWSPARLRRAIRSLDQHAIRQPIED